MKVPETIELRQSESHECRQTALGLGITRASKRPSESAGFDLLDFLHPFRGGVEPNTDIAVTLSKLTREFLYRHAGVPGRLRRLDDPLLQGSARSPCFCFGRCAHLALLP